MTDEYRRRLEVIGEQLGVSVHICLGGFANKKFARSWERKLKLSESSKKGADDQNNRRDDDDIDDDVDDDDDDDNDDDDDDDDGGNDGHNGDSHGERRPTGAKRRRKGLNSKPKLGTVRKMVKWLNSSSSSKKFGEKDDLYGGRMTTRWLANQRKLQQEQPPSAESGQIRGEDDLSLGDEKNAERRKRKMNKMTATTNKATANDVSGEDDRQAPPNEKVLVEGRSVRRTQKENDQYYIDFTPNCIFFCDDLLINRLGNGDMTNAQAQTEYLNTLRMIQGLVTIYCNHFQISLILTSQFALSGSGNNQISSLYRSIKANLDAFCIFPASLKSIRLFLSSFTVGEDFQKMKTLFTYLLENSLVDDPSDVRTGRPYVFISFGNTTRQHFKCRQFLFNLNSPTSKPYCPMAFINIKSSQQDDP